MRAIGDSIIVDPYYDPEKIGSLYMPDTAKTTEPQQGVVLSAGPRSTLEKGDYVLFHPFRGDLVRMDGRDVVPLNKLDVVATAIGDTILPLDDQIMVQPDWDSKYGQPSKLVYMPPTALEQHQAVMQGTITAVGIEVLRDSQWAVLQIGVRVIMQPAKGSEIGWINQVYYFLRPQHILACLPF